MNFLKNMTFIPSHIALFKSLTIWSFATIVIALGFVGPATMAMARGAVKDFLGYFFLVIGIVAVLTFIYSAMPLIPTIVIKFTEPYKNSVSSSSFGFRFAINQMMYVYEHKEITVTIFTYVSWVMFSLGILASIIWLSFNPPKL